MANRRTKKTKPTLPTLAEVKARYGLFLSAVEGHLVARYWTMWSNGKLIPGHKAKSVGQVRRAAEQLGHPVGGVAVSRSEAGDVRVGSLPRGRGAGRVQLDLKRIEAVPAEALAIRDVRVALQRAIRDGAVIDRKATEYHAQLCATLTAEHEARLEAEAQKQAREATTDATNETSDAAVGGNA